MQDEGYVIRPMGRDEVDVAVEWAAREGWNPGLHDAACFYAADPAGFLGGFLNGTLVGTVSMVKYGADFAFGGFYIVDPAYRSHGYGAALVEAALAAADGRTIGQDGVVAQQDNYREIGFATAYRNIRYEGKGGGVTPAGAEIVALSMRPFAEVEAYDRPCFPAPRTAFLEAWIAQPAGQALGIVRDGALAGYGVVRPCRVGHKIGPLFAGTPADAEALFQALAAGIGSEEPVFLDTPEVNPEAVALAERHGMTPVFETARMYKGPAPELPLERIFGVTSFELG